MKNLLILLTIIGLTSCSKDSLDFESLDLTAPEKSEIAISVTYLTWNDQCGDGCGDNGQRTEYLANARLSLYEGEASTNSSRVAMDVLNTDFNGYALFENLEPGKYTVMVETDLGVKSRILTTQLHRRAFIDFSF